MNSTYNPQTTVRNNDVIIENLTCFSLKDTLDCGQAFRWKSLDDKKWVGTVFEKNLVIGYENSSIVLYNTSLEDYENIWENYFDFKRDYSQIIKAISGNTVLQRATEIAGGIRILRQDPWEALCSFIISQNNNIPRIKGIIERFCENFGTPIGDSYSFPTAAKIAALSIDDLSPLRAGFRARYIFDAATKVSNGEIDFNLCLSAPIDDARQELIKICGVGAKVADCALLFGFGRIEAFPKDVWIKRAMTKLFDGELPQEAIPYAGIVQQYIFHYARTTKLKIE